MHTFLRNIQFIWHLYHTILHPAAQSKKHVCDLVNLHSKKTVSPITNAEKTARRSELLKTKY